jgi:hypothetical protein
VIPAAAGIITLPMYEAMLVKAVSKDAWMNTAATLTTSAALSLKRSLLQKEWAPDPTTIARVKQTSHTP